MKKLFLSIALLSVTGIQAGLLGRIEHGVNNIVHHGENAAHQGITQIVTAGNDISQIAQNPQKAAEYVADNPVAILKDAAKFNLTARGALTIYNIVRAIQSGKLNQNNYKREFPNLVLNPTERNFLNHAAQVSFHQRQQANKNLAI